MEVDGGEVRSAKSQDGCCIALGKICARGLAIGSSFELF
jgi:hypothetical protein